MGPGASLSRAFFVEEVQPIVEDVLGDSGYLAGRLGSGSDVLGFDDERSIDHDFGCRLTLLVDDDARVLTPALDARLEAELPDRFAGHPVRFSSTWDPTVRHKVDIHVVHDFAQSRLGFDLRTTLTPVQWLCLTGQSVLEVTGGPVFHDRTTSYQHLVEMLRWYPRDLWCYVVAAAWTRLSQELPLVGRTGQRRDDVGSRIIGARLSRDLIHLAFLLERVWPPYPKWTSAALLELPVGPALAHTLEEVGTAETWRDRQDALARAVDQLADRQDQVRLPTARPAVSPFFDRPYITTNADMVDQLLGQIDDDGVRVLPPIGSVEQWSDNVDLLSTPARRARAARVYE